MKKYFFAIQFFLAAMLVLSCRNKVSDESDEDENVETISSVTITHPSFENISETVELNAVSSYLLKTYVKANANGYLQKANVQPGQFVKKGETLFVIKTKEAEALGNTINSIDPSLDFNGTINVKSTGTGYVTQLTFTSGNYVQDGEQLAEITDTKSFVFILDLPYELRPYLPLNQNVELRLPDSTVLNAHVQSALPVVDSVAQTQRYILHLNTNKIIPENLIAKVRIVKNQQVHATVLPKPAILSNEEQTTFWIMQMINDSTAVKVPVQKGIEQGDKVQITSPVLSDSARILLTGNYGLEDTARVRIASGKL